MISTEKELIDYLCNKKNIYLFGAGKRAEHCLYFFKKKEISIDGVIVSKREDNPPEKDGKPVFALDEPEYSGLSLEEINLVVTVAGGMKKLLPMFCDMPEFKSILFISDQLQREINLQELKYRFEEKQDKYLLSVKYPKSESSQGYVIDRKTETALIRTPVMSGMQMLQPLLEFCDSEKFEAQFGPLHILPYVEETGITEPTAYKEQVKIYVVTSHMDKAKAEDIRKGAYEPIQVGADLTDIRKNCITDNTGDHISGKNRDFCECTGLYWIWKNTHGQKYTGICHYRRRLMLNDSSISYLNEHDIDLVVPHPQFEKESIREFFQIFICETDWQLLKENVIDYDEDYASCFQRYEDGHFYFPCNVAVWKRIWLDRYCEFAFSVAEKIDKYYRKKGIIREDRYMGYLFEQMSSLFIMRYYNEMNIVCSQIEWIDK